jgi:DNA-binding transcriptional regulator YdaS (Cro superfamily)
MNEIVLAKFTPQVLRGAEQLGFPSKKLSALLGVSESRLSRLACGLENLGARHARRLENETGRSVGELAVLGIAQDATPAQRARYKVLIRETLELLSGIHTNDASSTSGHARSRPSKRPQSKRKRVPGARARAA